MPKISSISISSFRGIPNKCQLDLSEKDGPRSLIIYGGNGSGKSSIVDALEFVLQGKIGRCPLLDNPTRPSIFNLQHSSYISPEVSITFADDSSFTRTVTVVSTATSNYTKTEPKGMCEGFGIVPIVLRRNDITAFNNTKEAERQLLISQFIYQEKSAPKLSDDPVILSLEKSLLEAKNTKRKFIDLLSPILGVSAQTIEEKSGSGVLDYCNSKIYHNDRCSVSQKGMRRRLVTYDIYKKAKRYSKWCDQAKDRIKSIQAEISKQKSILKSGANNPITTRIESVLKESSKYLTSSFKELSNADYVKDIRLSVGNKTQVSFNIDIQLNNGKTVSPTDIFSEANYDLMILLLYLSIIRVGVDHGQSPVLILDDVLQSVDSTIRTNFVDYILKELSKWQLIITCHDRLWLEQLRYMFNLRGHSFKEYHIYNWSFNLGPLLKEVKGHVIDNTLKEAIATNNIRIIASVAGPFLEMICNELSVSLKCSVKRVPLDKYTLGDLWPAVKKGLSKTSLSAIAEEIDKLLYIRNLLGCHYNQWADALCDEEVFRFAKSVQSLYEGAYCSKCLSWIQVSSTGSKDICCNCGILNITPTPEA